ncbi:MAG: alpha-2-macroglobulin family protein [Pseudomonadota bacterium]
MTSLRRSLAWTALVVNAAALLAVACTNAPLTQKRKHATPSNGLLGPAVRLTNSTTIVTCGDTAADGITVAGTSNESSLAGATGRSETGRGETECSGSDSDGSDTDGIGRHRASPGFQVLAHSPEGEASRVDHVVIVFSEPMVPSTALDQAPGPAQASLVPQPRGEWLWLGPRTLMFQASDHFPMATEYQVIVKPETRSLAGATLGAPYRFSFATPAAAPTRAHPRGTAASKNPIVFLEFDQAIAAAAILPTIAASIDGQPLDLRLANAQEVAGDPALQRLASEAGDHRWLAIRSTSDLPPDRKVVVMAGPGIPSAEGPRLGVSQATFQFRSAPQLAVTANGCSSSQCRPLEEWHIEFSRPLDGASFSPDLLWIEPPLPEVACQVSGNMLTIRGLSAGGTTYTVALSTDIRDVHGEQLVGGQEVSFKVGEVAPTLATADHLVTLVPRRWLLPVYSINMPALRLRAFAASPEDWPRFAGHLYSSSSPPADSAHSPASPSSATTSTASTSFSSPSTQSPRSSPERRGPANAGLPISGRIVSATTIRTGSHSNELTKTQIDTRPLFGLADNHLVLEVSPASARAFRPGERRRRLPTWVQSTALGISALADGERLLVWATSLETGARLEGVQLELLPDGPMAMTGANGLAFFALENQPYHLLVAQLGKDRAILPMDPADFHQSTGWKRRERQQDLRYYVLVEKRAYSPGEIVRIAGWARVLATPDDRSDGARLSLPGSESSRVSYRLSVGETEVLQGVTSLDRHGGFFEIERTIPTGAPAGAATLVLQAEGADAPHSQSLEILPRPMHAARWTGGPEDSQPDCHHHLRCLDRPASTTRLERMPTAFRRLAEQGFVFGNDSFHGPTSAASLHVGLRRQQAFVPLGVPAGVDAVVLDTTGRPLIGTLVELAMDGDEKAACLVRSASHPTSCALATLREGKRRISAIATDSQGRRFESTTSVWVIGEKRPAMPNELVVSAARSSYRPGDTAEILVSSPWYPAEALVTISGGDGILFADGFRLAGHHRVLRVPVGNRFAPGVEVRVDVVGADTSLSPEQRVSATETFTVLPDNRALDVSLTVPREPTQPASAAMIDVLVRDHAGRPVPDARLAILVGNVDTARAAGGNANCGSCENDGHDGARACDGARADGDLLTGPPADPLAVFYRRPIPKLQERHLRDTVVNDSLPGVTNLYGTTRSGTMAILEPSGTLARSELSSFPPRMDATTGAVANSSTSSDDSGSASARSIPRADRRLLFTSLHTDAIGHAKTRLVLPNTPGRYLVTVVAAANAGEFGMESAPLELRAPFTMEVLAPVVARSGDAADTTVAVSNKTTSTIPVSVTLDTGQSTASRTCTVAVPGRESILVRFPRTVGGNRATPLSVSAIGAGWLEERTIIGRAIASGKFVVPPPSIVEACCVVDSSHRSNDVIIIESPR